MSNKCQTNVNYFECGVCGTNYSSISTDPPSCCYSSGDPIGLYMSRIKTPKNIIDKRLFQIE